MKTLLPEQLYFYHNQLTLVMMLVWLSTACTGYFLSNNKYKKYISYCLIIFALLQEILDYLNRFFFDQAYIVSWQTDLPLQFCHFGFYFSIIGIIIAMKEKNNSKIEQFLFDCAYVLGFAGALQAMITVDLTGVYNRIGVYTLNWQHSLIILNVLWLIFAYNKKFTVRSVFQAFLFINIIILPMGLINYILDANYMFLCKTPNINSPFFIGEWPTYILWLELFYFIYVMILYIPFKIVESFQKK